MRRRLRGLVVALCWIAVALTALPLWQTDLWWVRLWDFPRLQLAALLLLLLIGLAALRPRTRWGWATGLASLGALGWQVSHFAAYFPPMPRQMAGARECETGRSLSLLNANVLQDNRDHAALLRAVEQADPDVLLLLETDAQWGRAVSPLAARYPYRIGELIPNTYGLLLLSRLPMQAQLLHRVQPDIPSVRASIRLRGGTAVRLHAVHPEPPLPGDDSGERDAELVSVGREVRREGGAAIVLGDLNDVAWSRTSRLFKQLSATRDPRAGRGFYPTFHAQYPLLRWPLDHLFATPHFRLMEMRRLDDVGSDHFPIFYRLCLVADADKRTAPASAAARIEKEAAEEESEGRAERVEEGAQ